MVYIYNVEKHTPHCLLPRKSPSGTKQVNKQWSGLSILYNNTHLHAQYVRAEGEGKNVDFFSVGKIRYSVLLFVGKNVCSVEC